MAYLTPLTLDDARRIARAHRLPDPDRVEPLPGGTVNSNFRIRCDGTWWFLRVYEEQDAAGVAREARISDALGASGVPVPEMRRAASGSLPTVANKPVAVFAWRSGEMSCQQGVTPGRCHRVGAALAAVHRAGDVLSGQLPETRFGPADLRSRLDAVAGSGRRDLMPVVARARAALDALDGWDRDLPRGLVHGDLFRDNVLWASDAPDRLAALLDWESASVGPWVYDPAVVVLSWCWGDRFEPQLARAVTTGYAAARSAAGVPLTARERAAFRDALRFGATRFLVTRLTDVELRRDLVAPGKDYRRFLRRLDDVDARDRGYWSALFGD